MLRVHCILRAIVSSAFVCGRECRSRRVIGDAEAVAAAPPPLSLLRRRRRRRRRCPLTVRVCVYSDAAIIREKVSGIMRTVCISLRCDHIPSLPRAASCGTLSHPAMAVQCATTLRCAGSPAHCA